jgi:dGTPase
MYRTLFTHYLSDLENQVKDSKITSGYLESDWISRRYLDTATHAELVRDFIAGMTDRYFAKRFTEITIPRRIEGRFT